MGEQELTGKIVGCAMKVHSAPGPGFLESVYAKARARELRQAGLKVECEKRITKPAPVRAGQETGTNWQFMWRRFQGSMNSQDISEQC